MNDDDLKPVYLSDGRAALRCGSIDMFRQALRTAVNLDFRNNVTLGNMYNYKTGEIEDFEHDGDTVVQTAFGFPGKTSVIRFVLPREVVREYVAARDAGKVAEPEPEVKAPAGWAFGQDLDLDLEPRAEQ